MSSALKGVLNVRCSIQKCTANVKRSEKSIHQASSWQPPALGSSPARRGTAALRESKQKERKKEVMTSKSAPLKLYLNQFSS